MKKFFSILIFVFLSGFCIADALPEVTNVTASQREDGSGIVDIKYTLSNAESGGSYIQVQVSDDGGTTWTVKAASLSGDVGSGVTSGSDKHIIWDSMVDLPGVYGENFKVKLTTGDMTWVYVNDSGAGMKDWSFDWNGTEYVVASSTPITGNGGFTGYMSKYETTNDQYCNYLNGALSQGSIVVNGGNVLGSSDPNHPGVFPGQSYYYLAGSGYTNTEYGISNGGAARINWTGSSFTVDSGFENHPVTYVSWYGATAFASYYGWRLPTEWEWQAVADYNGSYTYGCGTDISNSMANYWFSAHPHGTTAVGVFGSYGYSLCDMAGNVWEWTSSLYSDSPSYRVLRGGCWGDLGLNCAVSPRYSSTPSASNGFYGGFRVCR